jgi:Mn-containing catalase
LAEDDAGRKDMLLDIATEELSHLEIIGTIVAMLNKGAKGKLAEAAEEEAALFRSLQGAGNDSHVTQVLFGGGPALINSGGQLWTAGYIDSIGDPTCDLRSNIAAEARAKIIYERLINVTDDPDVKDALGFLMTREMSHQQSFEKALYSIEPNFPPGKLPGMPEFANVYVNTSQGEGDMRGSWNSDANFNYISDREQFLAMDGGSGLPEVTLGTDEKHALNQMARRTASDPNADPVTGVDLGSGKKPKTKPKTKPKSK